MQALLEAMVQYGVQAVLLVGVMFLGIFFGKKLRMRKDAKNNQE
jgi:hypothetical protein